MPDRYEDLYRSYRWEVPARYNIARVLWGATGDRTRFALYWEDESGAMAAYSFWDIQQAANRLFQCAAALGVNRGDRVAIILQQRPETAIAYMAVFQMGNRASAFAFFGPEALEYRMEHAEASIAIVSRARSRTSGRSAITTHLRHVIGVGGARERNVQPWEDRRQRRRVFPVDTAADDPALIIYKRHDRPTTARSAHRVLIGTAGFVHSHDFFQPGHVLVAGRLGLDRRSLDALRLRGCSASRSSATAAASTPKRPTTSREVRRAQFFLFPTALKL